MSPRNTHGTSCVNDIVVMPSLSDCYANAFEARDRLDHQSGGVQIIYNTRIEKLFWARWDETDLLHGALNLTEPE